MREKKERKKQDREGGREGGGTEGGTDRQTDGERQEENEGFILLWYQTKSQDPSTPVVQSWWVYNNLLVSTTDPLTYNDLFRCDAGMWFESMKYERKTVGTLGKNVLTE